MRVSRMFLPVVCVLILLVVTVEATDYTTNPSDPCGIQYYINNALDGDAIILAEGTYTQRLNLLGKKITLRGDAPTNWFVVRATIIDGSAGGAVITCGNSANNNTVITGLTVTNGRAAQGAGINAANASPTISCCNITDNDATDTGGGIYTTGTGGGPRILNCQILRNTAQNNGAGIAATYNSTPHIEGCLLRGNEANLGNGAGIYLDSFVTATIKDCEAQENYALDGEGGAIACYNSCSGTIEDSYFTENSAEYGGAIVCRFYSHPTLTNNDFIGNYASMDGGSLYLDPTNVSQITGGIIGGNADRRGGGFYFFGATTMTDVKVGYSTAGRGGGGYIQGDAILTDVEFVLNSADRGGALYCDTDQCDAQITGCEFTNNDANFGGAVTFWNTKQGLRVQDCWFTGNTADRHGGALSFRNYVESVFYNCVLRDNRADVYGGAIYLVDYVHPKMTNCTIVYNTIGGIHANNAGLDKITLTNSILYNPGSSPPSSQFQITYCCLDGNHGGPGNIVADPRLLNATTCHLGLDSPCIDAGNNDAVPTDLTTDLDGNPRILQDPVTPDTGFGTPPIVDMGAYEFMRARQDVAGNNGSAILIPNGGANDQTENALVSLTNTSQVKKTVTVTLLETDRHETPHAFSFGGKTVVVETDLANGDFFAQISIPFTAVDLQDVLWNTLKLQYWDESGGPFGFGGWILAVDGNHSNSVNKPTQKEGNYITQEGTTSTAVTTDLGDHGVFYNPTAQEGFVWANVDHTTDFAIVALFGDISGDNAVDLADAARIAAAWLSDDTPTPNWDPDCDLDTSGVIDLIDLSLMVGNWLVGK